MAAPWYFPFLPSYWTERYGYFPLLSEKLTGYLFTNFFFRKQPTFPEKMCMFSFQYKENLLIDWIMKILLLS